MINKTIDMIKVGDILGRDYVFYNLTDTKTFNHGITLNKGAKLTQSVVNKLKTIFNVTNLWIDDGTELPISETEYNPQEKIDSTIIFIKAMKEIISSQIIVWTEIQEVVERVMQHVISLVYSSKNMDSIQSFFDALGNYDFYSLEHSVNTAIYAAMIQCGLSSEQYLKHTQANLDLTNDKVLEYLVYNMLLHDIGKLRIPLDILNKPGKLTSEEYEIMKKHPQIGIELMRGIDKKMIEDCQPPIPANYKIACIQHHQNLDGTGYPDSIVIDENRNRPLKDGEIHIFGRIARVVDFYDAITTARPYRLPYHPFDALRYMQNFVDKYFDKEIFEMFKSQLNTFPIGNTLKLVKGGELAIVVGYKDGDKNKPIVKPYYKEVWKDGKKESIKITSSHEIVIDESDGYNKFVRDPNVYGELKNI